MQNLEPMVLKGLTDNHLHMVNEPPVTLRATFKLTYLRELLDEIENCPGFMKDAEEMHNVCITFVREDLQNLQLYGARLLEDCNASDKVSNVIPVISGCVAEFEPGSFKLKFFRYLRNAGNRIPVLRPGGEGTGLIPPPPPPGADEDFA
jgi:hypothetical protein